MHTAQASSPGSDALQARLARSFHDHFRHPYRSLALAPGRVNLIGEHTDYNNGLVLPIAIDAHCAAAAAPSPSPHTRVLALDAAESRTLDLANPAPIPPGHWLAYAAGVLSTLASHHAALPPLDLAFTSSIPIGAGLSSSAALEVSIAIAACRAWNIPAPAPLDLARLGQHVEHAFAGVPCGLMDQCASIMARAHHALALDCRSLTTTHAPFPPNLSIVILDTGVRHALASSQYPLRRANCAAAAASLGLSSLRDATPSSLAALSDPNLHRRARHVITENARVQRFIAALAAGNPADAGRLMLESHASLRDDYQVSCPELDHAVTALAASPGVYGARLTGAGFGGCAIALAESTLAPSIAAAALSNRLGTTARVVTPADGAWRLNHLPETT